MVITFLKERISWILLFLFSLMLIIVFAYIDPGLSMYSTLYMVAILLVIFIIFLFLRFIKEVSYYRRLENWAPGLDLHYLEEARSPFEKIIESSLQKQTQQLEMENQQIKLEIEQEKDELLRWIHEVKTPLTAMKLIIDRLEHPSSKSALANEWLRIHLLLDQQLHHKRMPTLENDLYIDKVSLEEILFREIRDLQSWCMQKGIGFELDLAVKEVTSDGKWLGFVIRQILSNAVKYSHSSEITIESEALGDINVLTISDRGKGISQKDLPRIYDKGFTSTADHAGHAATGMGLYLAKKAADTLKINIQVSSIINEGTTVTLVFPKMNDFVDIRMTTK
ncbi:sensor histidine kinase [Cytobacillus sp. FSL W7-1323]|uniref:histidine kinase n=1 Tax=Cytobacillus kochii TaxID=859143 RepID=A0A248TI32_9BACI|nr:MULTISPECIES: sensor histidine kinase [Cytobacillus]ASV67874.1 histidine kinase [Cytobacillus kochii]MEA1853868.1 sensor histidine kinase [Cytobacillus sp. OWB-43]